MRGWRACLQEAPAVGGAQAGDQVALQGGRRCEARPQVRNRRLAVGEVPDDGEDVLGALPRHGPLRHRIQRRRPLRRSRLTSPPQEPWPSNIWVLAECIQPHS